MTSKHLFFKCMIEDLRHRSWMLALSVLGNFLALPIAYLIVFESYYGIDFLVDEAMADALYVGRVLGHFSDVITVLCGIVAIAGALIVGLFGFRYVFHKNMIDTWHSLPIKRSTLFGVCYLDGFLIWFVPFIINFLFTICISVGKIYHIGGMEVVGDLVKTSLASVCTLVVSFFLIYNLLLVAVMLSGNVLNALVSFGVIGGAAISAYGIFIIFFDYYMDTFYAAGISAESVIYASPLVSAFYILDSRCDCDVSEISLLIPGLCINFAIAVIMGIAAWHLYQKRASELAEQGLKNRMAALLIKVVCSVLVGMTGWMVLILLTSREVSLVWGVFGNMLSSVLCFGILDIIFNMDFKAFAGHKLWMLASVGISILLCLSFWGDWYGYDSYLPKKTDISQMAVYGSVYTNCAGYGNVYQPLERMQIQDTQLIYDFLQAAVENTKPETEHENHGAGNHYDRFSVKVSLKNGKTYERQYKIFAENEEVVLPLILQKEYVDAIYKISEEDIEHCVYMVLTTGSGEYCLEEVNDAGVILSICEAYNQDLEENAKGAILGEGCTFVQLQLHLNADPYLIYLDVYEGMTHTIKALQDAGYGEYITPKDVSELSCIRLECGDYYSEGISSRELVEIARKRYYVYAEESSETDSNNNVEVGSITGQTLPAATAYDKEKEKLMVQVTDTGEMEELLKLIHYSRPFHDGSVFRKDYIRGIVIVDKYGAEQSAYIREGELPEKYIQKFGELGK